MGLFRRRVVEEPWVPPAPGACTCEEHVEALVTVKLPRVTDSGDGAVGALLESGSIAAEVVGPEPSYSTLPLTGQRLGPFHWSVRMEGEARDLFAPDAAAALDDCLAVQPGIERVLWTDHEQPLLVGAATMCPHGVLAALVRALENPRVRVRPTGPA